MDSSPDPRVDRAARSNRCPENKQRLKIRWQALQLLTKQGTFALLVRMLTSIRAWLQLARHPAVVRRAVYMAAVVGVILIAINHGPAIWAGQLTLGRIIQICLTIFVPYAVSTISSVAARNDRR